MTYDVSLTRKAKKQLKDLDSVVQKRIVISLQRIRIRPEAHVKKLVGFKYFSLKVGKYRVVLDIKHGKMIILVIMIAHRKHVYGQLKKKY